MGWHRVKLPAATNILDDFPKVAPSSEQLCYQVTLRSLKARPARVSLVPNRFVDDRRGALVEFQVFINHRPCAPVTDIALVVPTQALGSARLLIIEFAMLAIDTVALRTRSHVHCGGGPLNFGRCRGRRRPSYHVPSYCQIVPPPVSGTALICVCHR